jgi:hypothetical protein
MGNSEVVVRDRYLEITDEHFAKAAGLGGKTTYWREEIRMLSASSALQTR